VWQATSIPDPAQLDAVLAAFGIVVLPDGRGDFVHNAAIHVVDARGRLRRVVDPGRWQVALAAALEVE
jgi:protein SCO1/2